ncbi:MAG: hypothetical protein QNK78_01305 [Crocinitomicaceae bacterium]|nr:hypothetical protein [Crocinitomicaceae bacterium]MDC1196105.1 hypothetical protein [Crocinitomicaceae bacterium]MDC1384863.1 hypothetical protein [Crocinitomicaceae bacterium]
MKFRFLTKTYKNRQFDYNPMYYDERKERLEVKKRQYEKMENGELSAEERTSILRENIRGEWSRTEIRKNAKSSSNIRVFVLIVIIIALGYLVFNGVDQVETVVTRLW